MGVTTSVMLVFGRVWPRVGVSTIWLLARCPSANWRARFARPSTARADAHELAGAADGVNMATAILNQQIAATSDANGNIVFRFQPAPMTNQVLVGTVSIAGVPSYAQFSATTSPGNRVFGSWQGTQPFGPVETRDLDALVVTGVNVIPNTKYVCVWTGQQADAATVAPSVPSVLPAAPTFNRQPLYSTRFNGTASIGFVPPIGGGIQGTQIVDVTNFAGIRVGVENLGTVAVQCTLGFLDSQSLNTVGQHEFMLAGSATPNHQAESINFQIPVLGPRMEFTISSSPSGGNCGPLDVRIDGTNSDRATFSGTNLGAGPFAFSKDALLVTSQVQAIAALGTLKAACQYVYAGPCILSWGWNSTVTTYSLEIIGWGNTGNEFVVAGAEQASSGTGQFPKPVPFLAPPCPLRLVVTNGGGSSITLAGAMIMPDVWR